MSERMTWQQVREARMGTPGARAGYDRARRAHELAEKVRHLRAVAGVTQEQLATLMGTTQSAVARLEGGGVFPTLETLEKVAAALGARVEITLVPERTRKRPRASGPLIMDFSDLIDAVSKAGPRERAASEESVAHA